MAHLTYYNYPGVGETNRRDYHYSQAVRIGDRIECSGQGKLESSIEEHWNKGETLEDDGWPIEGGWFPEQGINSIPREINAQIDQAFANVDLALKTAGGKGWSQVYKVRSYHVPINGEALEAMSRNFKKWMPNHQPLYTCVGVQRLGEDDMRVEIEVEAHDPEGSEKK